MQVKKQQLELDLEQQTGSKLGKEYISSVQSLSRVRLIATPWTIAHQASLSITNSQNLLKLMSIESVIQPSHPLSSPSPAFNPSQHPLDH